MSLPDRFLLALGLTITTAMQACPLVLAQSSVLQGSVRHDYLPSVIRQEQERTTSNPVTVVRIQPAAVAAPVVVRTPAAAPMRSQVRYVERPVYRTVYLRDNRTFFERHPKVKATAVGAGVGAGVGAATGLITHQGIVRGALIGGGTGAGVGLVRSSDTLKRHPIMRNVATGSLVGLGIGGASSRRGKRAWQGAGIGAAVGLGASIMNGEFR